LHECPVLSHDEEDDSVVADGEVLRAHRRRDVGPGLRPQFLLHPLRELSGSLGRGRALGVSGRAVTAAGGEDEDGRSQEREAHLWQLY
jgi:hypothetical protein